MSALLAPLLAQLVTLGVADRTEARYQTPSYARYEGATRPSARLQLSWPHYDLTFGYGASLTLTPLESTPRDLLVYHNASVATSYSYRRTVVSLSVSGSMGETNFRTQALKDATPQRPQDGTTGTGTDQNNGSPKPDPNKPNQPTQPTQPTQPGAGQSTTGSTLQPRVPDGPIRYGNLTSALAVSEQVNRSLRLGAILTYAIAGGLNDEARATSPYTRGTAISVNGVYVWLFSARNVFSTSITATQAWSSLGNEVTSLFGNESWAHRFNARTASTLSAGVSITRVPFGDQYSAISVFPTFSATISHSTRLARGMLTLTLAAFSAPTLDPLRATVDPRVGAQGNLGWTRDRFSARVSGGASVSIADSGNNAGAFDNYSGGTGMAYRVTDWLSTDVGASFAQQAYQGTTTVPFSYGAFGGVTFGAAVPLSGKKR